MTLTMLSEKLLKLEKIEEKIIKDLNIMDICSLMQLTKEQRLIFSAIDDIEEILCDRNLLDAIHKEVNK